ncbi:hypothetical protein CVT25_006939 [Psilocybe cyanescens]|uniref:Uncharacterized protein n=1 Tax=Psilocybe cyanescens TaxID=93625 RepID=A0A409WYG7_PSICY|nr:hypothetical protein CVT25_006939 [Psilocybe cyanescens]
MEEELEETKPIMDITDTTDTPLEDLNALVIDFIEAKDSEEIDQAWINVKTTARFQIMVLAFKSLWNECWCGSLFQ